MPEPEPCDEKPERLPPFFLDGVAAGFPSPATDAAEGPLDLNRLCIRHPAASYFIRARGDSMIGAGIGDGDILIVDRALQARSGDIIIASLDGEFTVKRYVNEGGRIQLVPENPAYPAIDIRRGETACEFFGVVTSAIRFFRPC